MLRQWLRHIVPCALLICCSLNSEAQEGDTVHTDTIRVDESALPKHSPVLASVYSALVPGLGQAYNRKYWKIPIVWAGIGIPLYYGLEQNSRFNEKRDAYVSRLAGDSTDQYLEKGNFYSNEALLESMDINRRNRDLMYIIAGGIYLLQIIDASVDAHLFYFNVSDDLSFRYSPSLYYDERTGKTSAGLALQLKF